MDELGGKKEHEEDWDSRDREGSRGVLAHQTPLHLQGLVNFCDLRRGTRDPCRLGASQDTPTLSPPLMACMSSSLNAQQSLSSSYQFAGHFLSSARLGNGWARVTSRELASLVTRNLYPQCRPAKHGSP